LVHCERDGARTIWQAEGDLVDELCALVQGRLKQRLEARLKQFKAA
jgi:phage tail protein X